MEIFSKYNHVEKYSGKIVGTDELLTFIRQVSTNFIVKRLLKQASTGDVDKESQFYLSYRWTYMNNSVLFDDVNKIARAEGVNLELLWGKDGFVQKKGSEINVLGPKDRDDIKEIKSMVDAMHKTLQLWEKGKTAEINELLEKHGYANKPAFWGFCQAVSECLTNGNKEKQLLEGLLVGKEKYTTLHKEDGQTKLFNSK